MPNVAIRSAREGSMKLLPRTRLYFGAGDFRRRIGEDGNGPAKWGKISNFA